MLLCEVTINLSLNKKQLEWNKWRPSHTQFKFMHSICVHQQCDQITLHSTSPSPGNAVLYPPMVHLSVVTHFLLSLLHTKWHHKGAYSRALGSQKSMCVQPYFWNVQDDNFALKLYYKNAILNISRHLNFALGVPSEIAYSLCVHDKTPCNIFKVWNKHCQVLFFSNYGENNLWNKIFWDLSAQLDFSFILDSKM